jgi:hypothetical protein
MKFMVFEVVELDGAIMIYNANGKNERLFVGFKR